MSNTTSPKGQEDHAMNVELQAKIRALRAALFAATCPYEKQVLDEELTRALDEWTA